MRKRDRAVLKAVGCHRAMEADDASDNTRNGRIRRNNPFCDLIGQSQETLAVIIRRISQQEQVDVDPWSALNQREAARVMASKAISLRYRRQLNSILEALQQRSGDL